MPDNLNAAPPADNTLPSFEAILKNLNSYSTGEDPPKNTFEIGLVLSGTVSSGAYTAGFLDMLIQALDAWEIEKNTNSTKTPQHKVKIRVATGASGGAVNAAILARALPYSFPHVSPTTNLNVAERNPFYKTWVNTLDVKGFFDNSDISGSKKLTSLLNDQPITQAVSDVVNYNNGGALPNGWASRPYIDDPFHIILTLGNLNGVPHNIDFGPGQTQSFLSHADYARFACDLGAGNVEDKPDQFYVADDLPHPAVNWATLGKYARASGAFPFGFPHVKLSRPREHYDYRLVALPGFNGKMKFAPLRPVWDAKSAADLQYDFDCVDGGTFNNCPIELTRTFLAGVDGHNPRNPSEATRAVVVVDPLAVNMSPGEADIRGMMDLAPKLLGSMVENARFSTADMMLMADPKVFSRYLITPARGAVKGVNALATSGLGAFLGFFHSEYRRHDYMLGRANCREFLQNEFALAPDNPVFRGAPPPATEDGFCPIIPLVGAAALPDGPIPFPSNRLTANAIGDMAKGRISEVVRRILDDAIDFPLSDLAILGLKGFAVGPVVDMVVEQAKKDLKDRGL
jgi:hypothetical protein